MRSSMQVERLADKETKSNSSTDHPARIRVNKDAQPCSDEGAQSL